MQLLQAKNLFLSLFLLLPALTFAGEIFGTIKKDGKPLANQEVIITSSTGTVIGKATTDANGYYTINVKPIGKCTLSLTGYEGATFEVFSTNNSTDYTLTLVKAGDTWQLKKQ
jgi:hypothetical protein